MDREAGRPNEQKTGSHAGPSRGHRVLSIADNAEDHETIAIRRDYNHAASQYSSSSSSAVAENSSTVAENSSPGTAAAAAPAEQSIVDNPEAIAKP